MLKKSYWDEKKEGRSQYSGPQRALRPGPYVDIHRVVEKEFKCRTTCDEGLCLKAFAKPISPGPDKPERSNQQTRVKSRLGPMPLFLVDNSIIGCPRL